MCRYVLSRKSDAVMSSAKMLLQFLIDTEVFPRQFPQHISTSVKEKLAEAKGQASKLTADAIIGIIREVLEKIIFAHWSASQDFIESLESRDVAIKEAQVQLAKAQSTVKVKFVTFQFFVSYDHSSFCKSPTLQLSELPTRCRT